MGKSPDDIAGEIVDLRKESSALIDELMRRASFQNVARGATATAAERASAVVTGMSGRVGSAAGTVTRLADDVPEPIRRHPMATTYAIAGLLAGALGFGLSWWAVMRRPTATERAVERWRRVRESAGRTVRNSRHRIAGIREGMGDVRAATAREDPGMLKRVMWAGLASVMATLGSLLFRRLTASFWRTTMREEPPK